jgi:hypothetical protein
MCFGVAHRGPGFGGLESYAPSPSGPLKRYVDNPILKVTRCLNASLMKKLVIRLTTFVILIASAFIPTASAQENLVQPALYVKGDCKLIIEDAHISSYLLNKKVGPTRAVKANLVSECKYPQQKVIFQIWFLKKINGEWVKNKGTIKVVNSPLPNPYYVEMKEAYIECKNRKLTTYLIQARSWTTISGKEYPSLVGVSKNPTSIYCGI